MRNSLADNTQIIVALDTPSSFEAWHLVKQVRDEGGQWFKVGMELFYSSGGGLAMEHLRQTNCKVFLDLKINDIPTTVERAVWTLLERFPWIRMLSVRSPHAVGAALKTALAHGSGVDIVHVPVLSCEVETGVPVPTAAPIVVCRPSMVQAYQHAGHRCIAVGLRSPVDRTDDHAEPSAYVNGAEFAVIGRPITRAEKPGLAYREWRETICNQNGGVSSKS